MKFPKHSLCLASTYSPIRVIANQLQGKCVNKPDQELARKAEQESVRFLQENPDIESVELLIGDLNGVMRGKWAPARTLKKAEHPGINLPLSIFGNDIWGREVAATGLQIETGDKDGFCRLIPGRLARIPWAQRPSAMALLTMYTEEGMPFPGDPRHALADIVTKLKEQGLSAVCAFEMEFYLVDADRYRRTGSTGADAPAGPDPQFMYAMDALREHGEMFEQIRATALTLNLPVDTIIKEAAPGQYEINLDHRDDALAAADDAVVLRRIIREIADTYGITASFMAKPFGQWPGNGMHVHASLLDDEGNNVFAGRKGNGLLGNAAAGLLSTMRESMLLHIPSFNGFRRMQPGSYAPVQIAWGHNNRSVAVRVPASESKALRLEHRLAGADANPYLVLAGVLGGMLAGIKGEWEPPAPVEGNAYDSSLETLPDDMGEAIDVFAESKFVADTLGPELQRIYTAVKRAELAEFEAEITPLERATYL